MVRILLCGDVRGRLKQVCSHVDALHARLDSSQHFQAVFCVGEFTSEEMDLDVKPPIPVYFIDSGPAAVDLIQASPQGEEISENLSFLGHFGVSKIAGLTVAFLSGRVHPELFDASATTGDGDENQGSNESSGRHSADALREKYGVQDEDGMLGPTGGDATTASFRVNNSTRPPSWEALKAAEAADALKRSQLFIDGCYTPLVIERLLEEIGDAGGVDLLLTSEFPAGCLKGVHDAWPEEAASRKMVKAAVRQCGSSAVAAIAAGAEPKYHAVGLGGVFWRRPPWRHERRGEILAGTGEMRCGACRMISLGAVDGSRPGVKHVAAASAQDGQGSDVAVQKKPEKWLHGLDLDPSSLPAAAENATQCPWTEKGERVAKGGGEGTIEAITAPLRPSFDTSDPEERRRWLRRFGCRPEEMLRVSDKLAHESAPKEKKEKYQSVYKVSEKEKKRRKTGGDGHLPFAAKERMSANKG
eukprot:TRINITY_DN30821_c0_g1_i1.p1 TRINITY_DN30821_c0_g1~~TRINITY_DN30821_c0_g1_i1.p1  ORF type:complete len:472 (-),score=100.36 TRINITY_DN30821_c0_g1_i1:73-1488(-)